MNRTSMLFAELSEKEITKITDRVYPGEKITQYWLFNTTYRTEQRCC